MKITYQKSGNYNLINIYLSTALALILTFFTATSFVQQQDFSGTWKLNKEKSDLGSLPDSIVTTRIDVNQQTDKIIIGRFFNNKQNPVYHEILLFSGELSKSIKIGQNNKIAQIKWQDGKFTETANVIGTIDGQNFEINITEKWVLSSDKKQITIDRTVSEGNENATNHLVYDKQ